LTTDSLFLCQFLLDRLNKLADIITRICSRIANTRAKT
jgi:hypothetical protein